MLCSANLTKSLWAESCATAVYLLNLAGKSSVDGRSPSELWHGRRVYGVSHLKVFGTECFVHIPDGSRKKFDAKGRRGFVVGYVNGYDGYRVWVPELQRIICTHHVRFLPENVCTQQQSCASIKTSTSDSASQTHDEREGVEPAESQERPQSEKTAQTSPGNSSDEGGQAATSSHGSEAEADYESAEETPLEESTETKGSRRRKPPGWLEDYVCLASCPENYVQVMASEDKDQWVSAMKEELLAIEENGTWELVERPPDVKVLRNRWVLRRKDTQNGEKFKARLVACGQAQRAGIDFDETFSPVARYSTVRLLLACAAIRKMHLRQFDVKNAYLNGSLPEPVFMFQPEGFQDGTDKICRWKRGLHGLKISGRVWNRRLVEFMKKLRFDQSEADPCLFFKHEGEDSTFVTVFVDDGLLISNREEKCETFLQILRDEFKITVGDVSSYLGIQIDRQSPGSIAISQPKFTQRILEKFKMIDSNPMKTPAGKGESSSEEQLSDNVPYRAAVGSLLYLSTATRPDIAYAVGRASRAMERPTTADWKNVQRIFRYLRGTIDYGITYGSRQELRVYSDADYAGCEKTRRSTTGIVATYGGGAVAWKSQLQRTIALSTTEAEIMAASEATKELIWLSKILKEVNRQECKPTLYIDNASAVKLAKNPEFHARSKHIQIRHLFVREKFTENVLKIEHIEGKSQPADICTKALERVRFEMLRLKLGVQ